MEGEGARNIYYYDSDASEVIIDPETEETGWIPDIVAELFPDISGCKINNDNSKFVFFSEVAGISTDITEAQYNERPDGGIW